MSSWPNPTPPAPAATSSLADISQVLTDAQPLILLLIIAGLSVFILSRLDVSRSYNVFFTVLITVITGVFLGIIPDQIPLP